MPPSPGPPAATQGKHFDCSKSLLLTLCIASLFEEDSSVIETETCCVGPTGLQPPPAPTTSVNGTAAGVVVPNVAGAGTPAAAPGITPVEAPPYHAHP